MIDAMGFETAIVRTPCASFAKGLTTSDLGPADYPTMLEQHRSYVQALRSAGLQVEELPPADEFPDSHFVEDAAVVVPELAVLTRPGAPSRRGEPQLLQTTLAAHRQLVSIEAPGTLDGGDVLQVDKHVMVGLSDRTNRDGAEQLQRLLAPHGYHTDIVEGTQSLHLKSDVNWLGGEHVVVTPYLAGHPAFERYERLIVPQTEAYAANCLWINGCLFVAEGFPLATRLYEALPLTVVALPVSECRKMDGGLTCMSLRL